MTVKIAPEQDGLRNLKNKLVQLMHHVVPLGIEYPTSDPFGIRNHRDLNVSSGDQKLRETERSFIVHPPFHLNDSPPTFVSMGLCVVGVKRHKGSQSIRDISLPRVRRRICR